MPCNHRCRAASDSLARPAAGNLRGLFTVAARHHIQQHCTCQAWGSLVVISRGGASVQQFSVVKLKAVRDSVMFLVGLKPFPGRSPLSDIWAVMTSLGCGGSVRLQRSVAQSVS